MLDYDPVTGSVGIPRGVTPRDAAILMRAESKRLAAIREHRASLLRDVPMLSVTRTIATLMLGAPNVLRLIDPATATVKIPSFQFESILETFVPNVQGINSVLLAEAPDGEHFIALEWWITPLHGSGERPIDQVGNWKKMDALAELVAVRQHR